MDPSHWELQGTNVTDLYNTKQLKEIQEICVILFEHILNRAPTVPWHDKGYKSGNITATNFCHNKYTHWKQKLKKKKKIIRLNNQLVRTVNIQIAQTEMPLVNQNHVKSFTTLQKALNIFYTLNRIYNGLTKKSIIKL